MDSNMVEHDPPPAGWDAAKFALRYGYSVVTGAFYIDATGRLVTPEVLPDPTPIYEQQAEPTYALRELAKMLLDSIAAPDKLIRATVIVINNELNLHADKINSMLTAVDQATSLADLKSRFAAIADYPQRTLAQTRTAIKNALDTGAADS